MQSSSSITEYIALSFLGFHGLLLTLVLNVEKGSLFFNLPNRFDRSLHVLLHCDNGFNFIAKSHYYFVNIPS